MKIEFAKMHGCGNDYILIDAITQKPPMEKDFVVWASKHHYGICSDGVIYVLKGTRAPLRMRMHNADGSEAEMCGNGIRCLALYAYDRKLIRRKEFDIETLAGIKRARILNTNAPAQVEINMGIPPRLTPQQFKNADGKKPYFKAMIDGMTCYATSQGNPHCVTIVDNLTDGEFEVLGPRLCAHEMFPQKTNVEFVTIHSKDHVAVRVYERGSGETLACGTGACATVYSLSKEGLLSKECTVKLKGGELKVRVDEQDQVFLTGPAEYVCTGVIKI